MNTASRQPFRAYLVTIAVSSVFVPAARADAPWAPWPMLSAPGLDGAADRSAGPAGDWAAGAAATVRYDHGLVPAFRSGERDRLAVGAAGAAWFGANVCVRVDGAWLRDDTEAGEPVSGAGDLRLGTVLRLPLPAGFEAGTGWSVKLPNARDEGELGTDESDAGFGLWGAYTHSRAYVRADVGLHVLGNPLRFANQDDVPHLGLRAEWRTSVLRAGPVLEAELGTARNPPRIAVGGRVEVGRRAFVSAEGWGGLTPAAADASVGVSLGWRASALSGRPRGE